MFRRRWRAAERKLGAQRVLQEELQRRHLENTSLGPISQAAVTEGNDCESDVERNLRAELETARAQLQAAKSQLTIMSQDAQKARSIALNLAEAAEALAEARSTELKEARRSASEGWDVVRRLTK